MGIMSFNPAAIVFWGGIGIMTWTTWLTRRRPDLLLRLLSGQTASVADQAHRWLQDRSGDS